MEEIARMEGIHKRFGRIHAVNGVDFAVRESEVVGLVGDNGAGKSTLIKILSGLYKPDEGRIFVEGKEVKLSSTNDSRKLGIETIYQDQALVPEMSIWRNLFLGRELIKGVGVVRLLDKKKMEELSLKIMQDIGLNIKSADITVKNLSGGERQGVAIARAMYFRAKLLILDEPTAALSVKESQEVLNFISHLKEQGISSVFITHNLHHVYSVADRFVVLSHGRKVGDVEKSKTTVEELEDMIVAEVSDQIMQIPHLHKEPTPHEHKYPI